MKSSKKGKDFCIFGLPGMFCFFAVVIIPFVYGVYLTLTDWDGVSKTKNFIGLRNFGVVVQDKQFWISLLLTFRYVIVVVILVNVLALRYCLPSDKRYQRTEFFPGGILHTKPDRGNRTWLHMAVRIFQSLCEHRRIYKLEPV